ncbi:c-type cytochrome [Marinivivus vitaminiproducens]|uniref:c-type cytochrome n=1 Tax=Marinivivus vitaminiproducens TaxID=3035935 RepID=UPI0027A9C1CB|nr:cytochrome c family protein [Geminicoccaceae bacterium SCSIO 64248]
MASLEGNKIFAAVLTAGVLATGAGTVSRILFHPHVPEERHYAIDTSAVTTAGPAAEPEQIEPIAPMMAEASVESGEELARRCASCHNFEEGQGAKVGPDLYGVLGRQIASVGDFQYSEALTGMSGETWDYEHLNEFLHGPSAYAPGTKMSFAGLRSAGDRADLIAYLRTLSHDPMPMPDPAAAAPAEGQPAEGAEPSGGAEAPVEGAEPPAATPGPGQTEGGQGAGESSGAPDQPEPAEQQPAPAQPN